MGEGTKSRRERFQAEARNLHTNRQLTFLAHSLMHESAAAKDLYQSALLAAYDPNASPWDPDGDVPFVRHVGRLMAGMAYNERRRFFSRRVTLDGEMTIDPQVAGDEMPSDEQVDAVRLFERAQAVQVALLAAVENDDPRAAEVYRAVREGAEGSAAIAARVGCSPDEAAHAYKRITYHGRRVAREEEERVLHEMQQRQTSHAARTAAGASE
jgi:hypothetical protein